MQGFETLFELVTRTPESVRIPNSEVSCRERPPGHALDMLHPQAPVLSAFTFFQESLPLARVSMPATYHIFAGIRIRVLTCQMGAIVLTSQAC